METATLLLIISATIFALFIAGFQYIYKTKEKSQLNYWLFIVRFLSIFSILILLINPSIKRTSVETIKPTLFVAVDNSTSIKYNSQIQNIENFVNTIKNDSKLNDKFSINYYGFGNTVKPLDSLKFNENHTNLFIPFQEFSRINKNGINPVLIVTDGNQTVGNNVEFVNYKSPVFPFIVGDTTVLEDISINQLNVNKFTYINNQLPVELFVNYIGNKPVIKKLTVFNNGKNVYSKQLQFSASENVKIESFFLTATTKGIQYFTAKIEELENEQNKINNTKDFSIEVIDEKSEILIITSMIHPDLGMFKKSIESNKQRSVTITNIADFKGNIANYQLVILYQPSKKFESIIKEIDAKKSNFFIISGLNTDWDFLNKIQRNFSKKVISVSENYNPIFNVNYPTFLSSDIGFSNFAPLEDKFGEVSFFASYKSLLFQQIGAINTDRPLLATFEKNQQKGAVLFGENSWQWRMNSYTISKSFEQFDGFISNLIQYLASNQTNKRLNVTIESIYYTNETIQISASYLDKNFNFDDRAKLWLTITNNEANYVKKIPFAVLNRAFNIELSNIPFGEYKYLVSVENQTENTSGNFKILPFEVEQQYTNSNDKHLKIVATKTNGKIYYNNQEKQLLESLKLDERFKSIQKSTIIKTPLIDWKWLLGIIILLLSLEWFTRKYFGKI